MESTQTKSFNPVRGIFDLKIYDANGDLIEHYVDENTVVNQGKQGLTALLGGTLTGDKTITDIMFGVDGTPAAVTDTGMIGYSKALAATSFPADNSVQFDFVLEITESNGSTIRDFGLINADGDLFARKVRTGGIVKTSDIRLEGSWTIVF